MEKNYQNEIKELKKSKKLYQRIGAFCMAMVPLSPLILGGGGAILGNSYNDVYLAIGGATIGAIFGLFISAGSYDAARYYLEGAESYDNKISELETKLVDLKGE